MAKSRRKRNRSLAHVPASNVEVLAPEAYFSGYQGASYTTDRGQIWWPTISTRQELDSFSRLELIRRIHFLAAHFGYLKGIKKTAGDLVGWQSPQAQSGDEAWNKLAETYFWDVVGESAAFDVAGKFDFEDAQPMLVRTAMLDAHVFTVLTKWPDGSPRVAFYEASQLASPKDAGDDWVDGIQVARRTRRHIAYGFRNEDTGEVTVVPARFCVYFGEFDAPGEDAPVPPLAHAVNHSIDITEVWGFIKKAIKNTSLSGAVIERDANAQPPRGTRGMPGVSTAVTNSAGEKFQQANVWDGGQINALEPGSKMRILADNRPAPEQRQFILDLKRDISQGIGLPMEVTDEMADLTGPGIRFVMDRAGGWIRCRRKRLRNWAKRIYRYCIACGIDSGRLPPPPQGARWWDVSFTSQPLMTIDRGKESRARLDELDAGLGTMSDWEEIDGRDWRERIQQRVKEVAFATAECDAVGLKYEQVFRPRAGSAAVPAAGDAAQDSTPPQKP